MVQIRDGRAEDLEGLKSLYRALYDHLKDCGMTFDLEEEGLERTLEAMLRSRLCLVSVAEEDGQLLGFLCAGVVKMDRKLSCEGGGLLGLIHDLYILPRARRLGLAEALLDRTEAWFAQSGATAAECQVVWDNELGTAFWAGRGYAPVSVTRCKRLGTEEERHVVPAD